MAGVLGASLLLAACRSPDDAGPAASPSPTTAASEARDAGVATTTIGLAVAEPSSSAPTPVDGARLCGLLDAADLAALGPALVPMAGDARCDWTAVGGGHALGIASTALDVDPIAATQRFVKALGREAPEALVLGDGGLLLRTSDRHTELVVFVGDVRLDFDVSAARDLALDVARTAVHRLGPRTPIA